MIKLKNIRQVDDWDRPLYKDIANNYYCDVMLGDSEKPDIHYKGGRDSEPDFRIKNYEIINDTHRKQDG